MRLIDADDAIKEIKHDLESLWYASDIKRYEEGVEFAINRLEDIETIDPKQEWISVKDRLPEKDTLVLCVGAKGGMFLGYIRYLYGDDKTAYVRVPNARSGRYAAFWMPLPEPPEKNNEEEQE